MTHSYTQDLAKDFGHDGRGEFDPAIYTGTLVVSIYCNVLQRVAACYSVLQCVAVCRSAKFDPIIYTGTLTVCRCSVLQCVAVCCSVLQCVAVCCSVLQCVAVLI